MNKKLIFSGIIALGSVGAVQAQVISPAPARNILVDQVTTVTSNTEREAGDYRNVKSPFTKVETPEPVAEVAESSDGARTVDYLPGNLSDSAALRAVSQQFKPLGSLIIGDRGLLQLGNGRTIERGSRFNAEIQGTTYEVIVEEVTKSGYTLRLGDVTVERTFLSIRK